MATYTHLSGREAADEDVVRGLHRSCLNSIIESRRGCSSAKKGFNFRSVGAPMRPVRGRQYRVSQTSSRNHGCLYRVSADTGCPRHAHGAVDASTGCPKRHPETTNHLYRVSANAGCPRHAHGAVDASTGCPKRHSETTNTLYRVSADTGCPRHAHGAVDASAGRPKHPRGAACFMCSPHTPPSDLVPPARCSDTLSGAVPACTEQGEAECAPSRLGPFRLSHSLVTGSPCAASILRAADPD